MSDSKGFMILLVMDDNDDDTLRRPNVHEPIIRVPIILLKTKSTPTDAYADYFANFHFTVPEGAQQQHHYQQKQQGSPAVDNTLHSPEAARTAGKDISLEDDSDSRLQKGEQDHQVTFKPLNVPVLEHSYHAENIRKVEELLQEDAFDSYDEVVDGDADDANGRVDSQGRTGRAGERYGGIIFTSQRAVEGFVDALARVVVGHHLLLLCSISFLDRDIACCSFNPLFCFRQPPLYLTPHHGFAISS